jgi:hypothetical protein
LSGLLVRALPAGAGPALPLEATVLDGAWRDAARRFPERP